MTDERRAFRSRIFRALSRPMVTRAALVVSAVCGALTLYAGANPPATAAPDDVFWAGVKALGAGLLGMTALLAAFRAWVVQPEVAKQLTAHRDDERAHGIHEIKAQGNEVARHLGSIDCSLARIAERLDIDEEKRA